MWLRFVGVVDVSVSVWWWVELVMVGLVVEKLRLVV